MWPTTQECIGYAGFEVLSQLGKGRAWPVGLHVTLTSSFFRSSFLHRVGPARAQ